MEQQAKRLGTWIREHQWVTIGCVWAGIYLLACVGIMKQFSVTGEQRSYLDPFYRALQLFIMDDSMSVNGPIASWTLEFSRFAAPTVAAYTAFSALLLLFQDEVKRLRIRRMRGHVIVCGLGQVGLALVRDFRKQGDTVVAIDLGGDADAVTTCREEGVTVVIGDATESAILEKARIATARYIVCVTEHDGTNIEIAVVAYDIARKLPERSADALHCFVHIVDLRLCNIFSQHPIFSDTRGVFSVTFLNVYQNCARMLFDTRELDRLGAGPADPRSIHLIVVGFGHMGESIALQWARMGCLANGIPPRITVIDRQAETQKRHFYNHYPQADLVANFTFIQADADDRIVMDHVRSSAMEPNNISTFIIALEDGEDSVSCALSMLTEMGDHPIPIYVRRTEEYGLTALLESEVRSPELLSNIYPFGMAYQVYTKANLINEDMDALAQKFQKFHEDYLCRRLADGHSPQDASLKALAEFGVMSEESNRQKADHVEVKLRAIGCCSRGDNAQNEGLESVAEFLKRDDVELMARMEHGRFVTERRLAGFKLDDRDPSGSLKRSPYLVKWEELPESIKDYDRQSVRIIPTLLASIGRQVYRNT